MKLMPHNVYNYPGFRFYTTGTPFSGEMMEKYMIIFYVFFIIIWNINSLYFTCAVMYATMLINDH